MADTTSNMGLAVWDLGTDGYDHTDLADNWTAVDTHDHSPGKGVQLSGDSLANNSITSAKIVDGTIATADLANGSVTNAKLAASAVTTDKILNGTILGEDIADGAITSDKLDPDFLPVGSVILWYRPNSGVALPSGWEIMDGRAWSTIPNAWGVNTGNIPDMRNKFALGAAISGTGSTPSTPPPIGQVGGSHTANLAHAHTVASHTHTGPNHSHSIPGHTHTWEGGNQVYSRRNAFITGDSGGNPLQFEDVNTDVRTASNQSLYISGFNAASNGGTYNEVAEMDSGGSGNTGMAGTGNTGAASPATDSQLSSSTDLRNAHVGLLYIMKVN